MQVTKRELKRAFTIFDQNGDSFVSLKEMIDATRVSFDKFCDFMGPQLGANYRDEAYRKDSDSLLRDLL